MKFTYLADKNLSKIKVTRCKIISKDKLSIRFQDEISEVKFHPPDKRLLYKILPSSES